ncbi:hypothetical protein GCK32_000427 [Trichostrongylus colubriformis]|uniref:Uncharacterized protein n=1 Tax=Trichostrongylus colubriformis TaxID=6319 RepID=A0AAN8FFV3_TRICO
MPAEEKERHKKTQRDRLVLHPTRYSADGHPCEQLISSFSQFLNGNDTNNQCELNAALFQPVDLFRFHRMSEHIKKITENLEKQASDKKE